MGARITMAHSDDANGMDMEHSSPLSGRWGRGGFSAFETVPFPQPGGSAMLSRLARDTETMIWPAHGE